MTGCEVFVQDRPQPRGTAIDSHAVDKILSRMAALLEQGWCRGVSARDGWGYAVSAKDHRAEQWCLTGSYSRAVMELGFNALNHWGGVYNALKDFVGPANLLSIWNDQQTRVEDILTVIQAARRKLVTL